MNFMKFNSSPETLIYITTQVYDANPNYLGAKLIMLIQMGGLARESRSFFYPFNSLLMSQKKSFFMSSVFDFLK